jgi:hypothetical protein
MSNPKEQRRTEYELLVGITPAGGVRGRGVDDAGRELVGLASLKIDRGTVDDGRECGGEGNEFEEHFDCGRELEVVSLNVEGLSELVLSQLL